MKSKAALIMIYLLALMLLAVAWADRNNTTRLQPTDPFVMMGALPR